MVSSSINLRASTHESRSDRKGLSNGAGAAVAVGAKSGAAARCLQRRKCLRDHLIHIVVAVRCEPSDEMHSWCAVASSAYSLVESCIFGRWNRIVRISLAGGIFINNAGLWMNLPS